MSEAGAAARDTALAVNPAVENASVAVRPLEPESRFSLRLRMGAAVEPRSVAGFQLDTPINTCVAGGGRIAARLGPDEWLLLGPESETESIERELSAAFAPGLYSLVDLSHQSAAIVVAGPHAREIINAGCPLDLQDEMFPRGTATRTLLGKAEIVLLRLSTEREYRLECWRSYAPYAHAFLMQAAQEFAWTSNTLGIAAINDDR